MDVYHKVLAKIYEITGGKDSVEVDLTDLLRREGFFPSIDSISSHLTGESWVTEPRPRVVRITHWGVAEAKRVLDKKPDTIQALAKDCNRLMAESKEFLILAEDFASDPSKEKFKTVEKRFADLSNVYARIKANM